MQRARLSHLPCSNTIHGYFHAYVPAHAANRDVMSHPTSLQRQHLACILLQEDVDAIIKAMRGGW